MSQSVESIQGTISDYLVENLLDGDGRGLETDTDLVDGGLLDSFAIVQFVSFLEETYEVEIPRNEITADSFQSIRRVTDLVTRTLQKREAADAAAA